MSGFLRLLTDAHLVDKGEVTTLPVHKSFALLLYLALRGEWVTREELADLFRPDADEKTARHYLRLMIAQVRHLPYLSGFEVTPKRLRWLIDSDVKAFRGALGQQDLVKAVSLYECPLLSSFPRTDFEAYENWLELERASLHKAWQRATAKLAQSVPAKEAVPLLRKLLEDNMLEEDTLQVFLRVCYEASEYHQGLELFERFVKELDVELGLESLPETLHLAEALRQRSKLQRPTLAQTLQPQRFLASPQLTGREDTLHQLKQTGEAVVFLAGEPGIGKTSLAKSVAPNALYLRCPEGLDSVPYFALVHHLRANLQHMPDLGSYKDELSRLVPELTPGRFPPPYDPGLGKGLLLEAWSRYLTALTNNEPFAVIIDDAQWADAGTLELIVYLAQQHHLRVLACYRSSEVSAMLQRTLDALSARATTLIVEPLQPQAITDLLAQLIGQVRGPELFSKWLFDRTGGNPFFALETLKGLFASGALREEDNAWHTNIDDITKDYSELEIPKAVADVIYKRVRGLSETSQRVLPVAAVMGDHFSVSVLAELTGLSELAVLDVLEEAERAGVLSDAKFSHDLLRQSLYTSLSETKRKLLHAGIAERLAETDFTLVAQHYYQAGQKDKAADYWLRAARHLARRGLPNEAIRLLEPVISEAEGVGRERLEIFCSSLFQNMGAYNKAEEILHRLRGSKDSWVRTYHTLIRSNEAERKGTFSEALQLIEEARTMTPSDEELKQTIMLAHIAILGGMGHYQDAVEIMKPELGRIKKGEHPTNYLLLLASYAANIDNLGYEKEALPLHEEAVNLAEEIAPAVTYITIVNNWLGCLIGLGRSEEGIEKAETVLRQYDGFHTGFLQNNLASAYCRVEREDKAIPIYERLSKTEPNNNLRANAWACLAKIYGNQKNEEQCSQSIEGMLAMLGDIESPTARGRIFIACLNYGNTKQRQRCLAVAKRLELQTLPYDARAELESLLEQYSSEAAV